MALSISERLSRGLLLCDGATGTQLYAHGLTSALPEPANVEQPDVVKGVHLSYLRAGAELIETNTFGANAAKLGMHGMASRVEELNRAGVALAKEAARLHGQNVWVAGSMGPLPPDSTGAGLFSPASARNVFAEQAVGALRRRSGPHPAGDVHVAGAVEAGHRGRAIRLRPARDRADDLHGRRPDAERGTRRRTWPRC